VTAERSDAPVRDPSRAHQYRPSVPELERPPVGDRPGESIASPDEDPDVLLARAGWSPLLDRILRGVCHDLNSRASSLVAVTQLVELGEPLPDAYREEAPKLHHLSDSLQRLSASTRARVEGALPRELIGEALAMHARARERAYEEAPPVVEDEGVPAVLVCPGRVQRGLALLIDRCSIHWDRREDPVRLRGNEREATILIPGVEPVARGAWTDPLEAVFAMDGGRLRLGERGAALTFPSLEAARASGR